MKKKFHLIVGDIIFDRFLYGNANRVSAEAPTLVLDVDNKIDMLGGAYNVAAHLNSLDHSFIFVSVVGQDFDTKYNDFSDFFINSSHHYILKEDNRKTSIKTRLISNYKSAHLLRYDDESTHDINFNSFNQLISYVNNLKFDISDVIIIDYKKGVITKELAQELIRYATVRKIPVYVDTKKEDLDCFSGCNIIKPNKFEFDKIKLRYAPNCEITQACKIICEKLNIQNIVITAGNEGIYAFNSDVGLIHFESIKVQVKELSGAGDSVLAVLSYALSEGYNISDSVNLANRLASKFVSTGIHYRVLKKDF